MQPFFFFFFSLMNFLPEPIKILQSFKILRLAVQTLGIYILFTKTKEVFCLFSYGKASLD